MSGDTGKVATECVALLDSALHVPSAMEIQHDRTWLRAVWCVEARRNRAVRAGNRHVLDAAYRDRLTSDGGCPEIAECLTNLCDRQRPLRLARMRQLGFNESLQCRIECHRVCPGCIDLRSIWLSLAATQDGPDQRKRSAGTAPKRTVRRTSALGSVAPSQDLSANGRFRPPTKSLATKSSNRFGTLTPNGRKHRNRSYPLAQDRPDLRYQKTKGQRCDTFGSSQILGHLDGGLETCGVD